MNNKVTYDGSKIKVVHLEKDVGSVEATALNIVNSALASTNGDLQTVKKVFEFAVFLINLLELNSSEEEEKNNEEVFTYFFMFPFFTLPTRYY